MNAVHHVEHLDPCPACGQPIRVVMPTDWQGAVQAGASVPIVGCGNPWHYVFPERSTVGDHKPGESHQYDLSCKVCGQPGNVQVRLVPETA